MITEDLIVETLMDSDFNLSEHEPYAYVCDVLLPDTHNRLMDAVQRQVANLQWGSIEVKLKMLQTES